MDTLKQLIPWLLNPYSGTILFVIAIGYVFRALPFIQNRWIPFIVVLVGSLFFLIIAPLSMKPDPDHAWNWYVLMFGAGFILSVVAWIIHYVVISRLEDWARNKFPTVDQWFTKTSDQRDAGPH